MSPAGNRAVVRRVYHAFNQRDLRMLDELLAHDVIDHTPGEGQCAGIEGIKQVWARLFLAHPGIRCELEDMLAEDDKVATRVTLLDDSTSQPPTKIRVMEFFRLADGKIVELWNIFDIK